MDYLCFSIFRAPASSPLPRIIERTLYLSFICPHFVIFLTVLFPPMKNCLLHLSCCIFFSKRLNPSASFHELKKWCYSELV